MQARLALAALLVAGLAAVAFLALQQREEPARVESPPAATSVAAAPETVEVRGAPADRGEPAPLETGAEPTLPREALPVAAPAAGEARLAELRGRLVREDGSAVAGAELKVHGWGANPERKLRFGEPDDWVDPTGESDADGRFALRFDPPRAFQFTLAAKAPGLAEASWRWGEIRPGEVKDLGDVTLVRGGAIDVRILDAEGAALTQGWRVAAESLQASELGADRDSVRARAYLANADGVFRIEEVPPGPVGVSASSREASCEGPTVHVRSGETVQAEIRLAASDDARRITVNAEARPFHPLRAAIGSIHLFGPDGTEREAEPIEDASREIRFDELLDGEYHVTIDDPRFLPWSRDGVRPGTRVDARLKGCAALAVEVLDRATGAAVPDWSARLRFENVAFMPREFALVAAGGDPPASGVLDGIVPGDFTLFVHAEGYGEGRATVGALRPGETRRVVVRLDVSLYVPGSIAGIVRYGGGEPIPFVDVNAMPHEPADQPAKGEQAPDPFGGQRRTVVSVTSGEHGAFEFDRLGAGLYDVDADVAEALTAALSGVLVTAGETTHVVLETPPRCFLSGRCLAPPEATFEGLHIEIQPVAADSSTFGPAAVPTEIADDGTYRVGPVPPGAVAVRLKLPDVSKALSGMTWSFSGPVRDLDSVTLVAGENPDHDFDLRDAFPGRLHVVATRGAEPAAGWNARLFRVQDPLSEELPWRFAEEARGGALDARGEGTFGPLLPGEYVVVLENGGVQVQASPVATVSPGAAARLGVDATTYAGSFTVLDAESGEPLADRRIKIQPVPPVSDLRIPVEMSYRSDAEGRVAAELGRGAFQVFDGSNPLAALLMPELGANLDWGPAGPAQVQILLHRAEKAGVPNPFAEALEKAQEDGE